MVALTLGPVDFDAFEVPGRIVFGGRQRMAIHALPDGGRVVDTLGRDDAPIAWAGVFSGPSAGERARLLDLLRVQGASLPLAWEEFAYNVLIGSFEARFERPNWVPYRISCVVLSGLVGLGTLAISLAGQLQADLSNAALPGLDLTAATAAVGLGGATTLGTVAFGGAQIAVAAAVTQADGILNSAGSALSAAADLPAAANACAEMAQAASSRGYLQRAAANLSRAGS